MINVSGIVTFALVDVRGRKLNNEIARARKRGDDVYITLTGKVQDRDWSHWDGVSIEQALDVTKCEMKVYRKVK